MRRILLLVTVAATMAAMMALGAGSAIATTLHQHYLDTPAEGTTAEPGQGLSASCEEPPPAPHAAFDNFHAGLHVQGQQGFNQENNPVSVSARKC